MGIVFSFMPQSSIWCLLQTSILRLTCPTFGKRSKLQSAMHNCKDMTNSLSKLR